MFDEQLIEYSGRELYGIGCNVGQQLGYDDVSGAGHNGTDGGSDLYCGGGDIRQQLHVDDMYAEQYGSDAGADMYCLVGDLGQ